jgi:hypothetical protein
MLKAYSLSHAPIAIDLPTWELLQPLNLTPDEVNHCSWLIRCWRGAFGMVTFKWTGEILVGWMSGTGKVELPFSTTKSSKFGPLHDNFTFCRRDVVLSGMWIVFISSVSSPSFLAPARCLFSAVQQLVENRRSFRKDTGCAGKIGHDRIDTCAKICVKFPWILRSPFF